MSQNAILSSGDADGGIEERLAQRAVAKRTAAYASEVRRLLDAGLDVMRACGTTSRPRVSDVVAAAGLSNDAFYRHFRSKDALVAAILEDGAARLRSYLEHQMSKGESAEDKVRRWVAGVLSQAVDPDVAATTRAVLWNGGALSVDLSSGHSPFHGPLAALLEEPMASLGSADPPLDASLAAHAVVGRLSDCLRRGSAPPSAEVERVAAFCLNAVRR